MATRIYLPSSGSPDVTPSSWVFSDQINPLSLKGVTTRISSTMTSKQEATGTTNPTTRAMFRWIIGPLAAQTISGTVKMVMRASESASGANATLAMAVKIVQGDGSDRATLLGVTASDSATSPYEFPASLTARRCWESDETEPCDLTSQSASSGDYLVIEVGFRSATSTSRNINLRYGDASSTDLTYGDSDQVDNNPWVEFSGDISFSTGVTINCAAITLAGSIPAMDAIPGEVSPDMSALTLAGSIPTMDAVPGEVSPDMQALTLTGSIPTMDVIPGEASPDMNYITLAGSIPTMDVIGARFAYMQTVTLVGSIPTMGVAPGEVSPDMNYITLAGSIPAMDAIPGEASPDMNYVTLVGSLPLMDAVVEGGSDQFVNMQPVTVAGSIPIMDVAPGEVSPDMNYVTLAGSIPVMDIIPGATSPDMNYVTLAGSIPTMDVIPGEISPDMNYITLAGSIPTMDVIPGGVSPDMQAVTLVGSIPKLTVFVDIIIAMASAVLHGAVAALSVGGAEAKKRLLIWHRRFLN